MPVATLLKFTSVSHSNHARCVNVRLNTFGRDGRAPMIAVPEAHHHLFLDQPLAFVVALRALLAGWFIPPRVRDASNEQ